MRDGEKRSSVVRTVIITLTVIAAIAAVAAVLYNLFKKYFKVSLDCGDRDDCSSGCFGDDFDPMCDDDFAPECALDDEDEDEDEGEGEAAKA